MSFFKFLKTLVNAVCGTGQTHPPPQEQQPEPKPPHRPPQHAKPPPQHRPQQAPQQPSSPPPPKPHHKPSDPNRLNQSNEHYQSLRARANEEGDQMARCFQESHEAYSRGDGAKAKELSNEAKAHQRKMDELNKQASDWIYVENNKDSEPGEIDLHGLYVKEAIARTDLAVQGAKRRRDSELRLIVGKGLHSQGGAAKIKPAIEELMQKHALKAELDPSNAGVLVVQLQAGGRGGMGSEEISRRLANNRDEGCVIM